MVGMGGRARSLGRSSGSLGGHSWHKTPELAARTLRANTLRRNYVRTGAADIHSIRGKPFRSTKVEADKKSQKLLEDEHLTRE